MKVIIYGKRKTYFKNQLNISFYNKYMKVNFLCVNENNSVVNFQFSQVIRDGVIMNKYTHSSQFSF